MTRIPLHDLDSAPAAAQPLLRQAVQTNGYLSNLLATLAHAPEALEAYLTLSKLNAKGSLTLEEREVVQLVAARTHGCAFCVAGHTAISQKLVKMVPSQLADIREGRALENSRLEILARFVRAVISHRGNVATPDLEAFYEGGYDASSALQVVLGVSLATLCNFANNLGQPPLNPELHEHRWQQDPETLAG